jgi:hypothetical protein
MDKSTISMAIFNSELLVYQRVSINGSLIWFFWWLNGIWMGYRIYPLSYAKYIWFSDFEVAQIWEPFQNISKQYLNMHASGSKKEVEFNRQINKIYGCRYSNSLNGTFRIPKMEIHQAISGHMWGSDSSLWVGFKHKRQSHAYC